MSEDVKVVLLIIAFLVLGAIAMPWIAKLLDIWIGYTKWVGSL